MRWRVFRTPLSMRCFLCLLVCAAGIAFGQGQTISQHEQSDIVLFGDGAKPSTAIACDPDGRHLATDGTNNTVLLYDCQWTENRLTTRLAHTLRGHTLPVIALAFGGGNLVSVSLDQTVKIWDEASGKLLHSVRLNLGKEFVPAIAPGDQPLLAEGTLNHVRLWNYQSGELLKTFQVNDSNASTLEFTPDGSLLVIGTIKGVVRVLDVTKWKVTETVDLDTPVRVLAVSSNRVVVGYADGSMNLLNLENRHSIPDIQGHPDKITAMVFSPNGDRFASGSMDGTIQVWDSQTLKPMDTLMGQGTEVLGMVFSPDGDKLIFSGPHGRMNCWHLRQ